MLFLLSLTFLAISKGYAYVAPVPPPTFPDAPSPEAPFPRLVQLPYSSPTPALSVLPQVSPHTSPSAVDAFAISQPSILPNTTPSLSSLSRFLPSDVARNVLSPALSSQILSPSSPSQSVPSIVSAPPGIGLGIASDTFIKTIATTGVGPVPEGSAKPPGCKSYTPCNLFYQVRVLMHARPFQLQSLTASSLFKYTTGQILLNLHAVNTKSVSTS